jgi:LmbE family N-acetylglucosaminyl deacetylase
MSRPAAIAIAAHPDDIEFTMAGTLCLLREAGFRTHYLTIANGSCGSLEWGAAALRKIRRRESQRAAKVLGAQFHPSRVDDMEILYSVRLLRWLAGIIREVRPTIVLTHSPQDYMEDHTNAARLAVSAAFVRGMPNFKSAPNRPVFPGDATVYHAMPHGLRDGLGRRVAAGAFVDTTSVHQTKLAALACHVSQQSWLKVTQGMNSYLKEMELGSLHMGQRSRRFQHAEGWRRHAHMGFCAAGADPLRAALGRKYRVNAAYERALERSA